MKNNFLIVKTMTIRNLKLFFRDKTGVFFSFLSPIIILGLYLLFLRNVQINSINSILDQIEGFSYSLSSINLIIDSWLLSGVIAISLVTVTLGASYVMVNDNDKDIKKDFLLSPNSENKVMISYFVSIFLIGVMIGFMLFVVGQIYLFATSGFLFDFVQIVSTLGIIMAGAFTSTAFTVLITRFIKSSNAFSVVSTIVGTLIGFLMGAYMPLSLFSISIQTFANSFPFSHHAGVLRNIFMTRPLEALVGSNPEALARLSESYSLTLNWGDYTVSQTQMVIIVLSMGILLLGINLFIKESKKRR